MYYLIIKYPQLFRHCVAFSSAIYIDEQVIGFTNKEWNKRWGLLFGFDLVGKDRINGAFLDFRILELLQKSNIEALDESRFYLDSGDDDHLVIGNAKLQILLKELNINHEFRVRNGGHNWTYWRTGLLDGLIYISETW